jgi:two-component system sensor histidine kinase MtrB
VERILRNLLGNAIDHSEGRPVVVRIASDANAATIAVRDHGLGLRPGEAGLVFNRFWRGDPSRSRLTGGTGLGLAISMEDARLHGGWLQAWGERGRGALFRLTLPLRPDSVLPSRPDALAPLPAEDAEDGVPNLTLPDDDASRNNTPAGGAVRPPLTSTRVGAGSVPVRGPVS